MPRIMKWAAAVAAGSVIVKAGFDSAATNAVKAETGNPGVVPNPTITGPDGVMTVSDLFKFAGVA